MGVADPLKTLDQGVVASARAAGVGKKILNEMGKVLRAGPGRLEDLPRTRAAGKGAFSENLSLVQQSFPPSPLLRWLWL